MVYTPNDFPAQSWHLIAILPGDGDRTGCLLARYTDMAEGVRPGFSRGCIKASLNAPGGGLCGRAKYVGGKPTVFTPASLVSSSSSSHRADGSS